MSALRNQVKALGTLLGQTIADDKGPACLDLIEAIRLQGKAIDAGDRAALQALMEKIGSADDETLLTIARAFSQFLNMANIAEQIYTVSDEARTLIDRPDPFASLREQFDGKRWGKTEFLAAVEALNIDLVLTAHPTEVTRRTLIHKYRKIEAQLRRGDEADRRRIQELMAQDWHTNSIRRVRPTPVDEASWGLAVIEDSLWSALPKFMRDLDAQAETYTGEPLPLTAAPVRMSSWMGGDRDGNPFVTAKLTRQVIAMSRAKGAELFGRDLEQLSMELSMMKASPELIAALPEALKTSEQPYREIIRPLRKLLASTAEQMDALYRTGSVADSRAPVLTEAQQLLAPLHLCYRSLMDCGLRAIARGYLLDVIRRIQCFGIGLIRLDIRQHSERHDEVLGEITQALGLGDYLAWSEAQRQAFLQAEINNPRPLIPSQWAPSADVKEVLDTVAVIAEAPAEMLGIYIISMASQPSDVLLVELLQKACGVRKPLPVAPLFETLDDLDNAEQVMTDLLAMPGYKDRRCGHQYVMIGYSDSAKDAGVLAASWAQYRAQDALIKLHQQEGLRLTLFHGRGGTIGRGGGPAHGAILSQPPGSVAGGLRVTEQGETIRYKFGMPKLAVRSLSLYASAILEAMLVPPPEPKPEWRALMDSMANRACATYRSYVREQPDFVRYFRQATPEQELGQLPLGSRPAKRKSSGGIESLRAIPWIFAWTQNRLVLPSWLGFGSALKAALNEDQAALLKDMQQQWPFFRSRLAMMEMVYSKANTEISALYDARLVEESLRPMGRELRDQLTGDVETLLEFLGQQRLLERDAWGQQSLDVRQSYLVPLHLAQIELLARVRANGDDNQVSDCNRALMVAMTGIAAGMRNTG
ncbi:phosphoenolpyruvate carboxylase [Simiduia aestuariiviva]|uniref:Phosphoenolpyruvate carboxylase n=1 Tax=Simiduia aestuariiviva TaxID=1510459 RepID=A0A839UG21_9GAMM|nr:phosphoenolpyruvate carboxylase [Simiduia aestuariiviva]MBB3166842.1 phosphoenolpyruvate carboxylase [Simiduia aestuariiviva]